MWRVIKSCINQDTGRKMEPGEIVCELSAFEIGRHLAEKNMIPMEPETASVAPPENQMKQRGRPRVIRGSKFNAAN